MTDQHANIGRQAVAETGISGQIEASEGTAPSYSVNGDELRRRANRATQDTGTDLRRTSKSHGITHHELRRLSAAMHFMEKWQLWTCAIGDEAMDANNEIACALADDVKSFLTRYQDRAGLPLYWIEVIEVSPSRHSHLVFVGNESIALAVHSAFPSLFVSGVGKGQAIERVHDRRGLVEYLSWERTPQASASLGLVRKKGSFRLEGLGDRVKLSRALKRDAIEAGLVEPWRATNTARKPRTDDRRALHSGRRATPKPSAGSILQSPAMPALVADVAVIKPMPQTAMVETQLELFALAPPARLRDYHGGLMPTSVSQVIEFKRRQRGYTQEQLGRIAGISQSTLANAISGRFGLSEWAANRIREALAA